MRYMSVSTQPEKYEHESDWIVRVREGTETELAQGAHWSRDMSPDEAEALASDLNDAAVAARKKQSLNRT
jgi:hypothetical protein